MSKKSVREKLRSILSEYDHVLARYAGLEKEHAEAVEAARKFEEEISAVGAPSYRDAAAFDRIDSLKRRLAACQDTKQDLAKRIARKGRAHHIFAFEAVEALTPELRNEIDALLGRATDRLKPYYSSRERAHKIAYECDAVKTARSYLENLINITENCRSHETGGEDFAAQIREIVEEALKDAPDLERFFPLRQVVANR